MTGISSITDGIGFRRKGDAKLASVFLAGVLAGGLSVTAAILVIVRFLQ